MTIRGNEYPIPELIFPQHVLLSVFDKDGLDELVQGLLGINPNIMFYSTGGTGKAITEILGDRASQNYTSVEGFTGSPEMEGGLVKTLHPKIHAGLLGERGNPEHERYIGDVMEQMTGTPGVYFDVLVGNLYPFEQIIMKSDVTPEEARINIDIGGPTMVKAAAKNWHSVAVLTNPKQYSDFVSDLVADKGISAKQRFNLARRAFIQVGNYEGAIGNHFAGFDYTTDILPGLNIQ
ncbi:MAG: hypothetical protein ISS25_03195 [Nanoarchaeota archaeon]|nr:hypothetical protein [DPANN group archaeon]MBL7116807.1 hypothetical protein [Nanoarchaeota archaeon]